MCKFNTAALSLKCYGVTEYANDETKLLTMASTLSVFKSEYLLGQFAFNCFGVIPLCNRSILSISGLNLGQINFSTVPNFLSWRFGPFQRASNLRWEEQYSWLQGMLHLQRQRMGRDRQIEWSESCCSWDADSFQGTFYYWRWLISR